MFPGGGWLLQGLLLRGRRPGCVTCRSSRGNLSAAGRAELGSLWLIPDTWGRPRLLRSACLFRGEILKENAQAKRSWLKETGRLRFGLYEPIPLRQTDRPWTQVGCCGGSCPSGAHPSPTARMRRKALWTSLPLLSSSPPRNWSFFMPSLAMTPPQLPVLPWCLGSLSDTFKQCGSWDSPPHARSSPRAWLDPVP